MADSNILFLPFRKTNSLALSSAIKQYISSKYEQHPDMFKQDLEVIDALRRDAVHVREPHTSGIKKIAAYAGQISWMGGKFPIDIGVDFVWYPALGYNVERPITENNLKFELANVLYNLAALYSQLATNSNRGTTEGLRAACNYFCQAAGVISHIKTEIIPELRTTPPEDMDDSTLESLEYLMLAQAQECFWQKAVMDGYKDASIAKLAAKVSDFYGAAGDWGVKSEAVSSEWIHHTTAKHHHFAAAAQYRQACDCLEKRKYGEEVARLRDSIACVNEALKEARYLNKVVLGDLNGLKNRVTEDLKRAEKDNDLIYLNPVPPKSELKTLERANMAFSKVPKEISEPASFIGDTKEFGPPLFAKLVPFAVHVAASIYEERRDRLVNDNIIAQLELLTNKIHNTLRSLNLPGSLQALEKPLGLPPTLTAHAEEIRQADALTRLQRSFSDTAKLKSSDEGQFAEGRELLQAEASEEQRLRLKYGTDRWTRDDSRTAAAKLYAKADEIGGYLKGAASSDASVLQKFRKCEDMLRILSGSDRDIGNFVPSSRRVAIPPQLEGDVSRLRSSLNEVSRLESRRRRKIEALREKAKKDDINTSILAEAARLEREYPSQSIAAVHFEDFFDQRLTKYDVDSQALQSDSEEQDLLLQALEEANSRFVAGRKGDKSSKEREQALQSLETAYWTYKEIVRDIEGGRKFYNELANWVQKFRNECRDFVYQRREEAQVLESELSLPPLSSLNIHHPPPPLQSPLQPSPSQQPHPVSPPPRADISAPVPQRTSIQSPGLMAGGTWDPGMGIKFGGTGGGAGAPAGGNQTWDPKRGFKFG
ncbi:hypothetical protein HYFRA_00009520 [Hymenoscyphus fraxineus]|uniref:BRO1 domain-containing protein n=1 Tax=Hymenoscyphus fraxineus TaxID=746836 RepID=A0A9N9PQA5_9HELO|nr:hypothetical protein HYFRA_00009520 [Hymenoscyphus fraxineus]